jgi:predicted transcriptional regulator
MSSLPNLSRFELQCLRKICSIGEVTVRDVHRALPDPPSYSTVRTIVERLEEKGAVKRLRKRGKAWVYGSAVSAPAMIRKEVRRFLEVAFDGVAASLVAQLADMHELSLEDVREVENQLREQEKQRLRKTQP